MVRAMERVEEISAFALVRMDLSRVPVNRLSTPARYGQSSKAQTIERAPEQRRTADDEGHVGSGAVLDGDGRVFGQDVVAGDRGAGEDAAERLDAVLVPQIAPVAGAMNGDQFLAGLLPERLGRLGHSQSRRHPVREGAGLCGCADRLGVAAAEDRPLEQPRGQGRDKQAADARRTN